MSGPCCVRQPEPRLKNNPVGFDIKLSDGGCHARQRQNGNGFGGERIGAHWTSYVLDVLLAQILESVG